MYAHFDLVSSVEEGRKFLEHGVYGVHMCGFLQQKSSLPRAKRSGILTFKLLVCKVLTNKAWVTPVWTSTPLGLDTLFKSDISVSYGRIRIHRKLRRHWWHGSMIIVFEEFACRLMISQDVKLWCLVWYLTGNRDDGQGAQGKASRDCQHPA